MVEGGDFYTVWRKFRIGEFARQTHSFSTELLNYGAQEKTRGETPVQQREIHNPEGFTCELL